VRHRLFLFIMILASLFMGYGCGKESSQEPDHHEGRAEHDAEPGIVHFKKESQKMIGFEITRAEKSRLESTIEVVGEIAPETENVAHVTCPEPGILKSYLVKLGEVVEKETPLCVIQTKEGGESQIKSPSHGIVLTQYAKEGDFIDPITSIMTIADPDILRASFSVYEKDLAGVALEQKIIVKSIAYPGSEFQGEVVFISPRVDEKTRTVKIRANVENKEHLLKLGMFVTGEIAMPIKEEALIISPDCVQTVEGRTVVFIPKDGEEDEFFVKEVKVGRKTKDQVEILDGLSEGDEVVAKGSFYLKTELLKGELGHGHAH